MTIFGQSGGGRKVSLLMAAPCAQGLFERGIVQSGPHLRLMAREAAQDMSERLLAHFGLARSNVRAPRFREV